MTDTTAPLPPAVLTAIATLRTAAYWLPDDQRTMLLDAAHRAEVNWDGRCCPVCEETFCDGGCPLEDVRTEMYKREAAEPKVPAEVIEALSWAGRRILEIELAMASTPSPFRDSKAKRQPSPACYEASWGWVHSRPSCRCKA